MRQKDFDRPSNFDRPGTVGFLGRPVRKLGENGANDGGSPGQLSDEWHWREHRRAMALCRANFEIDPKILSSLRPGDPAKGELSP